MAIKRAIFHLGMTKAGSSSIQHTLFNNALTLEKHGFKYLGEWGLSHFNRLQYLLSPCPVYPMNTKRLGKKIPKRKQINKNSIDTLLKVINTTECETLIISGEYFHELYLDLTIKNIKTFINKYFLSQGIEITIVYIVRNPLSWLISWTQQILFRIGFQNKNEDFFESAIQQYRGVFNLKKEFHDSLKIIKFEDACLDKDGFVENFLKEIGFPESDFKNIDIVKWNEARCMEAIEFIYYVESVEPRYPYHHYKKINPNRFRSDLNILKKIKGVKFDLPFNSKEELWARLENTVSLLKETTGIDYSNYKTPFSSVEEAYGEETIRGFIEVFPDLSVVLQKHFLKFFEKKYMETAQEKFKQLHYKDSVTWKIYNSKNYALSILSMRIKYKIFEIRKYLGRKIKN